MALISIATLKTASESILSVVGSMISESALPFPLFTDFVFRLGEELFGAWTDESKDELEPEALAALA